MARTKSRTYAYPTSGSAARQRQMYTRRGDDPRFRVIEGSADETSRKGSVLLAIAAAVIVGVAIFAVISFARIAFVSASVHAGIEKQAVAAELAESRSAAGSLEVQDTLLSNTARIQGAAEDLDMAAPAYVEEIYLSADVVATDAEGNLSFGESVRRASEQAAGA